METKMYEQQVNQLKRAPLGRVTFIPAGKGQDPAKLRNMLSVTANRLWGRGAAVAARHGRVVAVCRIPVVYPDSKFGLAA
jgi:hypothetical protein